jgi:hypothetical protein
MTGATLNGANANVAATDSSFWVATSTFSTASSVTLPAGVFSTPSLGALAPDAVFSSPLSSVAGVIPITPNTTYYFAAWSNIGGTWIPGAIESFTTGSTTLPGTLAAQDFGVMNVSGVNGYTAGFGLTDATFAGVQSAVVQLYSGTTLLQTDTLDVGTANVTALTGAQISSPFDVSGTFDYTADGYWTNVRGAEYGKTMAPTSVVATVTLANSKVVTATNTNLTGTSPAVTTLAATAVVSTGATLNGVNANTAATDSSFWVSTSTFSTASSAALPSGVFSTPSLGALAPDAAFSSPLSSVAGVLPVTPNTTYYFAAWTNIGGTWQHGAVMTFTTAEATAPVAPVVSSVSPSTGTTAGGTVVTITGVGFTGETAVKFGTIAATGVVVNSDSSITATSPATSTAGVANITVTTPVGTSVVNEGDRFVYSASSGSIGGTVTGPAGVLMVTSITPVKTSALSDNTYADGWSYIFNITVPTNETNLSMSFSNWLAADANMIPVAGNMQISSAQALASTTPVTLTAANVFSSPLNMIGDLSTTTPGLQVQVLVQVKIPVGSANDSYTTNYGVQTLH